MKDFTAPLSFALEKYIDLCDGPANWKHWGSMVTVLDWEAAWLTLGLDPKEAGDAHAQMQVSTDHRDEFAAAMFFGERRDVIESYFNAVENERAARFRAIRNWLEQGAIWCQMWQSWDPFTHAVEVHQVRISEVAARAIAAGWQIPDQLAQLVVAPSTAESTSWPWGTYETNLLRELSQAAKKFWVNYDPADPTTAPTNEAVASFLIGRGVSDRVAQTIAQILRADGLRPGPRTPTRGRTGTDK